MFEVLLEVLRMLCAILPVNWSLCQILLLEVVGMPNGEETDREVLCDLSQNQNILIIFNAILYNGSEYFLSVKSRLKKS